MLIKFASPFIEMSGEREGRLTITKKLKVKDFIPLLIKKYPKFNSLPPYPYGFFIIINKRHIAKIEDYLDNSDQIEIIPPILGG